jgi:Ca2+-binding RTX toxin-like protein
MWKAAVATLLLVLTHAAGTQAATAGAHAYCDKYSCSYAVRFTAASGERNDVAITWPSERVVLLHDGGARLAARDGCAAVDASTVRCQAPGYVSIEASLGDGDDRASVTGDAMVDGGAGNDHLTGDAGQLTGGPGADVLTSLGSVTFVDGDGDRQTGTRAVPEATR